MYFMTNYTLNLKPFTDRISDRNLQQLCRENPDLRFEINAEGNLIVMSPTGSESGRRNGDLFLQYVFLKIIFAANNLNFYLC